MKDDEKRFLMDIYRLCSDPYTDTVTISSYKPRDLINEPWFYMHHKRAWYLLGKWADKDWYEWGVTMDLGWLTATGIEKAEELAK